MPLEKETKAVDFKERAEYWQKKYDNALHKQIILEKIAEARNEQVILLKEMIQGKDQRIHFLLGQIESYEKILFRLSWLANDETGGD